MAFAVVMATPVSAQLARSKVYISVDLEGIAGVVANSQTTAGGLNDDWAPRLMLAETNAAIEGAFAGGATEVLVNDSHGSQTNLKADEIDRRAMLITGQPKPLGKAAVEMAQGFTGADGSSVCKVSRLIMDLARD